LVKEALESNYDLFGSDLDTKDRTSAREQTVNDERACLTAVTSPKFDTSVAVTRDFQKFQILHMCRNSALKIHAKKSKTKNSPQLNFL
jgi:hypothetical protein